MQWFGTGYKVITYIARSITGKNQDRTGGGVVAFMGKKENAHAIVVVVRTQLRLRTKVSACPSVRPSVASCSCLSVSQVVRQVFSSPFRVCMYVHVCVYRIYVCVCLWQTPVRQLAAVVVAMERDKFTDAFKIISTFQ